MGQKWLLLLFPLFIPASSLTLDEETSVTPASKMEDIVTENQDFNNTHQLFKRRFTGYKDFNKYKFAKSKSRTQRVYLRKPFASVMRSKRSSPEMLSMLRTVFSKDSEEMAESDQIHYKENASVSFYDKLLNKIDTTLNKLNDKLEEMEKEKGNAYIMMKVPGHIDDYIRKVREKRDINEYNEDRLDDDSNITVIALRTLSDQETTTNPNPVSEVEEKKVELTNTSVSVTTDSEKDSTVLVEPPLDTNKTETINNEEIKNNTFDLGELRNDTRKFYVPDDDNYILKMEEILGEIHFKLSSLKPIKETYSKLDQYKVGYIIAHLESAEETIQKLLNKLKTREKLSREQAQNILDKVTMSSMVVTNLMNFLGRYSNPPVIPGIIMQ